jgi:hypothetical protein
LGKNCQDRTVVHPSFREWWQRTALCFATLPAQAGAERKGQAEGKLLAHKGQFMKKASKPANSRTPAKKAPAPKKIIPVPRPRATQGQVEIMAILQRLADSVERMAQAAERLSQAAVRTPKIAGSEPERQEGEEVVGS